MECIDVFKLLYYALDSTWNKTKNEDLGEYCSEMNPFLWKDEGSADLAVYSNFKEKFNKQFDNKCSVENGFIFSKQFLDNDDSLYAKSARKAFKTITLNDWKLAYNDYKKEQ